MIASNNRVEKFYINGGEVMSNRFEQNHYVLRKKIVTLLDQKFHVYDTAGNVIMFSVLKAFKLKEDIRIFTDETKEEELVTIKARSVIDFSAAYDVVDAKTGEHVGALRRKGMKSILRDEWQILNQADEQIGIIQEDSMGLAMVRRLLFNLLPQKFTVSLGGQEVAEYKQNVNPFVQKIELNLKDNQLDRRLAIASGLLLLAIEGKQD